MLKEDNSRKLLKTCFLHISIHFLFWLSEIQVHSQLAKLMISLKCKLLPLFRKYINVKMIVSRTTWCIYDNCTVTSNLCRVSTTSVAKPTWLDYFTVVSGMFAYLRKTEIEMRINFHLKGQNYWTSETSIFSRLCIYTEIVE